MKKDNQEIITQLRNQILEAQGYKTVSNAPSNLFGLGKIESCFPNNIFPTATVHEFLSESLEEAAASEGFLAGLLGKLMENENPCLWISCNRKLFPPALQAFNIKPEQIIFIDVKYEKEILWVMEEALKCEDLAAVIAEMPDIDFAQSRRLQLATEKSRVTGILLRKGFKRGLSATACAVRWRIKHLPSELYAGLPGVGYPRWEVNLIKVRNGHTGKFILEWAGDKFVAVESASIAYITRHQQAG